MEADLVARAGLESSDPAAACMVIRHENPSQPGQSLCKGITIKKDIKSSTRCVIL
jgi:hypothetical protein